MLEGETLNMFDLLSTYLNWIKAVHIIFVIFWMAGLLYLPRLFVYHYNATPGSELDTVLQTQERKLLRIIMNPAMFVALFTGLLLVYVRHAEFGENWWLTIKLAFVFILFGFHGFLSKTRKRFAAGERPKSEKYFRVVNEIPAILTIFIVILAVVEPF